MNAQVQYELRTIPLNQLHISSLNVRKTGGTRIESLAASIKGKYVDNVNAAGGKIVVNFKSTAPANSKVQMKTRTAAQPLMGGFRGAGSLYWIEKRDMRPRITMFHQISVNGLG